MSCETIQARLQDYLAGALAEESTRTIDAHLERCASCRAVLAATQEPAPLEPPADLVASVLERTSGRGCPRAESLLCDRIDDGLESLDRELLRSHTRHCRDCATLDALLPRLVEDLRSLRELSPDAGFTGDVLAATSRAPGKRAVAGLAGLWQRWVCRPRFAWEAAYVGAMLIWLAFGSPLDAIRGVPAVDGSALSPLRAISSRPPVFVAALPVELADLGERAVVSTRVELSRSIDRIGNDWSTRSQRTSAARSGLRRNGGELRQAVQALDVKQGYRAVKSLTGNARELVARFVTEDKTEQE